MPSPRPRQIVVTQGPHGCLRYNPPSPHHVSTGDYVTWKCSPPGDFHVNFPGRSPFPGNDYDQDDPGDVVVKFWPGPYKYSIEAFGQSEDPDILVDDGTGLARAMAFSAVAVGTGLLVWGLKTLFRTGCECRAERSPAKAE